MFFLGLIMLYLVEMTEEGSNTELVSLSPPPKNTPPPHENSIDLRKVTCLQDLTRVTRNGILGLLSPNDGPHPIALWQDFDSVASLMTVIRARGGSDKEIREAMRLGWKASVDTQVPSVLEFKKVEEPPLSEETKKILEKEKKTLGVKIKDTVIDKAKSIQHLPFKIIQESVQKIVYNALVSWTSKPVDFEAFCAPFLEIANLNLPPAYLKPEKGGEMIGTLMQDPVYKAYQQAVENGMMLKAKKRPANIPPTGEIIESSSYSIS